jgi:heme-degrading monooxygenase HmoA
MNISSRHQTVFRIDRFVVPAASEAEFLSVVTETNTVFEGIHGCLQHHVLKQEGASGDCNYITVVEWVSFAAVQKAREAVVAKHKAMNLDPQEMFTRLQIKAELGNYVPVAAKKTTDWPHSTSSMSPGRNS